MPDIVELCNTALDRLELLMDVLKETKRRGRYDILVDNIIVTRWKRRKLKESERIALEAKLAVEDLRDALGDDVRLDTEELFDDTKMMDYFLGGIGAIVVQGRINTNYNEVAKVHEAVTDILRKPEG